MLVNATPIRSEQGAVESVVVTLQDLTKLDELERLQADFLGMVSHELRAPLTSIKGSAATLLQPSTELDAAEMREFHRIIDDQADNMQRRARCRWRRNPRRRPAWSTRRATRS